MADYLQWIYEFLTSGIYQFFVEFIAYVIQLPLIIYIHVKMFILVTAFNVAMALQDHLGISDYLQLVFAQLNSPMLNFLNYIRFFDALNVVTSALLARFLLTFI